MERSKKYILLGLIGVLCCIAFYSCKNSISPPSIENVQRRFHKNYQEIQIVQDFLCSAGYDTFQIRRGEKEAIADGHGILISDEKVWKTIQHLLTQYQNISKSGNTIEMTQWSRLSDVGCGIAYSINGIDTPEIQYVTQIEKLPDSDWFYYVDDYNEWRLQNKSN